MTCVFDENVDFEVFFWENIPKLLLLEFFRRRDFLPPIPNQKCDFRVVSRAPETIRKHVFHRSKIFGGKRPGWIFS